MATPIPSNGASFTLGEIARVTGGTLVGGASDTVCSAVSTDTRGIAAGALFVALVGETHDGHQHVATALGRGAAAALVNRGHDAHAPRIEVDDTLLALGQLARAFVDRERAKRPVPSIGITGSAGKTTTKELTAAVVRAVFGPTLATRGNLNNLVGVPMTLFTLSDDDRAMVIECGTNARGEIARLGAIVAPDVGLVLNADAGHTAGLGGIEDVAIEKGAMFTSAQKFAIGNADDPPSRARLEHAKVPTLLFGQSVDADFRLVSRTPQIDGTTRIGITLPPRFVTDGVAPTIEADLALPGLAAALDATAAIAALAAMRGRLSREDIANAAQALSSVKPTAGRFAPAHVGDVLLIDDTYNANPRSMRASIATAREIADGVSGRLVLVLGDMLELGELAPRLHAEIGEEALRARASVVVTVGEQMALAARVVVAAGVPDALVVETMRTDDAATALAPVLRARDVVLVKGSRGMRMEGVVEQLSRDHTLGKVGP